MSDYISHVAHAMLTMLALLLLFRNCYDVTPRATSHSIMALSIKMAAEYYTHILLGVANEIKQHSVWSESQAVAGQFCENNY